MPSKRKLAPVVGRDGINGTSTREQELSTVELDSAFGRLLGLYDGQKVCMCGWAKRRAFLMKMPGWTICASRSSTGEYHQH